MKHRFLIAALAAATTTHAIDASAQWLEDRRIREGAGIRTGDVEIHPGVAAELGYDSNYFQRSGDTGSTPSDITYRAGLDPATGNPNPVPGPDFDVNEATANAVRLRVTPHIAVSTLSQQRTREQGGNKARKLDFRAEGSARYNELFAANDVGRQGKQISNQRHVSGNVGADLNILPTARVGADLYGNYTRAVAPSNSPEFSEAWNRHLVIAGGGINFRPGGGLFTWRLGYQLRASFFQSQDYKDLNNVQHRAESNGRWEFLPRTALISRTTVGFIRYNGDNPSQNDGEFVQTRLGVNGLITPHFGALVMGGWASSFYEDTANQVPQNYDSFIGQAELSWYPTPQQHAAQTSAPVGLSSVSVGYTRAFSNSYIGDYFTRDRVYAGFTYFGMGVFVIRVNGGYSRIGRPEIDLGENGVVNAYGENRIDATIFGEYRPVGSVGIFTTLNYNANLTNAIIPTGPTNGGNAPGDNLAFQRFEAWLGTRWFL